MKKLIVRVKRSRDLAVKDRFSQIFVVHFVRNMRKTAKNKEGDRKRKKKGNSRKNIKPVRLDLF